MKIIALKNNLKEALLIAERSVGESAHLPILKNVFLRAEKDKNDLFISSTNLEIGIITSLSTKIIESGTATISASLLSSLISNIPTERLDIETKAGILEIKTDNYEVSLPLGVVDDFPIMPPLESIKAAFKINGSVLIEALQMISAAVQFSDIRPEISGIFIDFSPDELTLAGTDIFRLSEKKINKTAFTSLSEEGVQTIIPIKTAQEISRIFKKDEEITVEFDDTQVHIKSKNTELISRLINGTFPDYKGMKIIPAEFMTTIETNREEVINALKLSGAVSQSAPEVSLVAQKGKKSIEIKSSEKGIGRTKAVIPAKMSGEDIEIFFNWRYLSDGLKGFQEEIITLGFNGHEKPALLRSADTSFLYVLMPAKK